MDIDALKEKIVNHANKVSGRSLVYEERQDHMQRLRNNIGYQMSQKDRDQELIDFMLDEYSQMQMQPAVRVYENTTINDFTADKYEGYIGLLRELNEDNKNQIEIQFRKMRRDEIKSNFTSSALKREVVYRVYDVLNDDCLEDEITELKLGNKSKHLSKFKMQCEEQGKTHVNDQLKECVIPATTALVIKNEIAIINLRLHHLDQSNLYHLFAMESAWWCLYMTIKTLKPNYKKIIIEPIGVTNLTHSGAIGLLKAFSSSSSPAAPAAAGDIYEVYGPSVSVYHSRQIGFKLPWPLWSHTHFQKHLKPHPLTMEMAKYIVDSCPVVTRTKEIDILLIQRSKSRRLVDSQTGESDTVFHILSQLTPNLKVVEFSNTDNFCDIVSLIQSAKIIIGVHGAGLTNLAWANPNTTTVIEILMRPGFQDLYIKSEYTNMARFFGIKYKYFDSIKVYPHLCGVYCEKVFINTKELKESILLKR